MRFDSYLVCREHVKEVKEFLSQFLEENIDRYSHESWITFKIPGSDLKLNLMKGSDQPRTKNFTLEISFETKEEFEAYCNKFSVKMENFRVTEVEPNYIYHFAEIYGPEDICKVEISYIEEL